MDLTNILDLQQCLLSKDNDTSNFFDIGRTYTAVLAELSPLEGQLIPLTIRTGPMGKPDPGLLKRYQSVEINGEGMAYVKAWIQNRLVAWGTLFAQEGPKRPRRLNIPRGLGIGYDIDLFIAFQGRLTGYEVFYEVMDGGDA
jgi:hypothetical protein